MRIQLGHANTGCEYSRLYYRILNTFKKFYFLILFFNLIKLF